MASIFTPRDGFRQTTTGALERLCNYILKPPIAHDRLELLDDGRVRLRFTRPWSNGATHQIMAPLDLIARLVALVRSDLLPSSREHTRFATMAFWHRNPRSDIC
jgi:hypothetical protein